MTATIAEGEVEGHPVWTLSAPGGEVEATFAVGAGMVGCSLRHRGQELLAQRKGLDAYARTGSTVGIPLLAPWANRLDGMRYRVAGRDVTLEQSTPGLRLDPGGLPIHGLLGGSPDWKLVDAGADADGARLSARLDFGARTELLDAFPFPHVLEQEVSAGATAGCRSPPRWWRAPTRTCPCPSATTPTCSCPARRARNGS